MKSGSASFYIGIIALIAGTIATFMGYSGGFAAGFIFFSIGAMGRLFENEVVDSLLVTFVGVGALVFVLNFGQTHFGGHSTSSHDSSAKPAESAAEHH